MAIIGSSIAEFIQHLSATALTTQSAVGLDYSTKSCNHSKRENDVAELEREQCCLRGITIGVMEFLKDLAGDYSYLPQYYSRHYHGWLIRGFHVKSV